MYSILLGVPSSGLIYEPCAEASWLSSYDHHVIRKASCTTGLNFNPLLADALNLGKSKEITHFAIMHSDVRIFENEPGKRWLDRMAEEMDKIQVPFLSVPNSIKDHRAVTASGVGDPNDRWSPFRRFTVKELVDHLPTTFRAQDIGYGDKFLLHNEALCLMDMRDPRWYIPDETGRSRFHFGVFEEIRLVDDHWVRYQETEDWSFSRDLWTAGIESAITTRIHMGHIGTIEYPNFKDWGKYQHGDHDTSKKWRGEGPLFLDDPLLGLGQEA